MRLISRVRFQSIRCIELQDSLLKSGNKTANIYVKKTPANGDGSKTIKSTNNHTNIDIQAVLVWLIVPFYDFCGF